MREQNNVFLFLQFCTLPSRTSERKGSQKSSSPQNIAEPCVHCGNVCRYHPQGAPSRSARIMPRGMLRFINLSTERLVSRISPPETCRYHQDPLSTFSLYLRCLRCQASSVCKRPKCPKQDISDPLCSSLRLRLLRQTNVAYASTVAKPVPSVMRQQSSPRTFTIRNVLP